MPPGEGADLSMHYTVGVPVAALRRFLTDVADGDSQEADSRRPLRGFMIDADDFAEQIGKILSERHRVSARDRAEIEGVLALTYIQVTALIMSTTSRDLGKSYAAAVSRTSLRVVRRELSSRARHLRGSLLR